MKITIKATNLELTDSLRQYIEEKIGSVSHILRDENTDLVDAKVEVGKLTQHHHSGPFYLAEVNCHMGGILFRATAQDEDLYAAIDAAKDELLTQVRKFKDKKISQLRHAGKEQA